MSEDAHETRPPWHEMTTREQIQYQITDHQIQMRDAFADGLIPLDGWEWVMHPETCELLLLHLHSSLTGAEARRHVEDGGLRLMGCDIVLNAGMAPTRIHRRRKREEVKP